MTGAGVDGGAAVTTLPAEGAFRAGAVADAYRHCLQLVADPAAGAAARARAGAVLLQAGHLLGRGRTVLALYESVLAPAARADPSGLTALDLALARGDTLLGVGDLDGTRRHAAELRHAADVLGDAAWAGVAQLLEGLRLLACGRGRAAVTLLREAEHRQQATPMHGARGACQVGLALACALTGQLRAAGQHLTRARGDARTVAETARCQRVDIWLHLARGEQGAARQLGQQQARDLARVQLPWLHLQAVHDLARLEDSGTALRLLRGSADLWQVEGDWAQAARDHIVGLGEGSLSLLERAEDTFTGCGLLLEAWECAARAAALHGRAGHPAAATLALQRAHGLEAQVDGMRTPGTSGWLVGEALTLREREIVAHVCQGLRSVDVAERLGISVRTVESHLHHAYAKLGVSDRRSLRALTGDPA